MRRILVAVNAAGVAAPPGSVAQPDSSVFAASARLRISG